MGIEKIIFEDNLEIKVADIKKTQRNHPRVSQPRTTKLLGTLPQKVPRRQKRLERTILGVKHGRY